jgi:hypothetical protein
MLPALFWQGSDNLMVVVSMLGVHFGIGSNTLMDAEPALPEQFRLVSVTLMEGSPFAFQGSFSWFLIDMEPT